MFQFSNGVLNFQYSNFMDEYIIKCTSEIIQWVNIEFNLTG